MEGVEGRDGWGREGKGGLVWMEKKKSIWGREGGIW